MSPETGRSGSAWLAWLAKAVSRVIRLVCRCERNVVAVLDLRGGAASRLPLPGPGRACREMTPEDLDAADFAGFGRDRLERARARFGACQGRVVTVDGRPAGWAFMTTVPRSREGWPPFVYAVTPPPGMAYVFDVFVPPAHRRRGLARDILACCGRLAARDGLDGLFLTYAHPAMARATAGLGFRPVGTLRYRRVLWHARTDVAVLDRMGLDGVDLGSMRARGGNAREREG